MSEELNDFYNGGGRFARPPQLWTFVFIIFVLLNFFVFMGFDILLPTLSLYLEAHGNSEAEIGRIFGTFTLSAVLMRTLASRLASKVEAFWLVRIGLIGCAVAGIYYAWAVTVPTGMANRFLHGAGFGLASTLITALASQVIPPTRIAEGLGFLGLGTTIALALGPFFGIWLVDEFGYLPMFGMVSGVYVLGVGVTFMLPKIKLASAAPGAPKPRLVLLSRKVWAPSALMFMIGLIMGSITIYMALFCKEIGLPYAGHFFVVSTVGLFISRFTAGRIHDRLGHKYVLLPSLLMLIIVMLLLSQTESRNMLLLVSVVYGLATGAAFPSIQAIAMSSVPLSGRTEATASLFNSMDLGIGSGALFFGYVANLSGSYASIYLWSAGASFVMLLFYLLYYQRPRSGKGTEGAVDK